MIGAHILKDGSVKHISAIDEHKANFKVERLSIGQYKIWHNLNSKVYSTFLTPYYEPAFGYSPEREENFCIVAFTEMVDGESRPKDIDFDITIAFPY